VTGSSYVSLLFHLCPHVCIIIIVIVIIIIIIILSVWVGTALLQLFYVSW
jgi:hypothetical protein